MKRIAWITPDYFIETDIYIVPELSKHYVIDWYITYSGTLPFEEDLIKYNSLCSNLKITFLRNPPVSMLSIKMLLFYWNLITLVKDTKPSFIYTAILNFPFVPIVLLRLPRGRTAFAAHNVITPKGSKHYYFIKTYQGCVYRFFKNFQTFSQSQFEQLNKLYRRKNVFLAPFVMKDYGEPTNQPSDIITFLFYGRIRGYKSPEVVINAAQEVKKKTKIPFKVIIAGSCDNWEKYQAMIIENDIFDLRISFIPNDELPNLFGESHYTLLPYQGIAQSGALFVGINYAKPSILSRLSAFEEVLTDEVNSIFIKPADTNDMVEKMLYVINNHETIYPKLKHNLEVLRDTKYDKNSIIGKYRNFIDKF